MRKALQKQLNEEVKDKYRIIAVDDQEVAGMILDDAVSLIRGEEGTTVKVTVRRGTEYIDFVITREKIEDNKLYRIEAIESLGFDLLTFKSKVGSMQKLIRNAEIKRKFDAIRDEYDIVFVDTPPCGIISDASVISQLADSIIYVIREDAVIQKTIRSGISSMLETEAKFLGCILNGAASGLGGYGGYYRYNGYYKSYRYSGYSYSNSYGYGYKRKKKKQK